MGHCDSHNLRNEANAAACLLGSTWPSKHPQQSSACYSCSSLFGIGNNYSYTSPVWIFRSHCKTKVSSLKVSILLQCSFWVAWWTCSLLVYVARSLNTGVLLKLLLENGTHWNKSLNNSNSYLPNPWIIYLFIFLIHFSYIHLHTEIWIGNQNTEEMNHTVLPIGCGSGTQRHLFLI